MFKLSEIIEGWKNDLFPEERLKEIIQKVSDERLAICETCIAYDKEGSSGYIKGLGPVCNKNVEILPGINGCGCPLNKKRKCLKCQCPASKWLAVVTEEEEEQFKLEDND